MTIRFVLLRELPNGNLELTPTEEGVQQATDAINERLAGTAYGSPDDQLHDMLEYYLCNGWSQIPPEAIGALTDGLIISEDFTYTDDGAWAPVSPKPKVYWHSNYTVEDPVEVWAEGKAVYFDGADLEFASSRAAASEQGTNDPEP